MISGNMSVEAETIFIRSSMEIMEKALEKGPPGWSGLITGSRNGRQIYCAKLDLITCVTG
ncbi:MAG: hypothetical protein CM1200mP27_01750 [Chloroflexota bacterium]|nr:MAG: hypothetical protein CM1200mP27_01750 [Chloroflexota bacterium]